MEQFNNKVIQEFRANGGKVGGMFAGFEIALITMKGARSGSERTVPLVYTRDGDNYVIIASMGGAPKHPQWFHNIKANPDVTVEVGGDRFRARASIPDGAERDRIFNQQASEYPNFAEYQSKTSRTIPVIVLERV
jgi:deazaflavin-dependent oxidoreductase (nitroreductase family)